MTQAQLNEIWRKHNNGDPLPVNVKAYTDGDGIQIISTTDMEWHRAQEGDCWEEIPPFKGNL